MSEGRKSKRLSPKTCWVTYGLQGLSTEKFLEVVQKIMDGEFVLIKPCEPDWGTLEMTEEYF